MAHASKTHMGAGSQGKGSGAGAASDIDKDKIEENMILSNRDKSRHSDARGQDSKQVQADQYQDSSANQLRKED